MLRKRENYHLNYCLLFFFFYYIIVTDGSHKKAFSCRILVKSMEKSSATYVRTVMTKLCLLLYFYRLNIFISPLLIYNNIILLVRYYLLILIYNMFDMFRRRPEFRIIFLTGYLHYVITYVPNCFVM